MASLKTSTTKRRVSLRISKGFTLLEVLIVLGLIAMVGSTVLFVDLNSFRGDSFRAERSTVATLLGQARMEALNNIGEEKHGVAFFPSGYPHSYVLFEGESYAVSDPASRTPYPSQYDFIFSPPTPSEVVFSQLSGDANYSGKIVMLDTNRNFSYELSINSAGGITW